MCEEGELPVWAHLTDLAEEVSWRAVLSNGTEICAEDYSGSGGVDRHLTSCCLPADSGVTIQCEDSGADGWHGGYLEIGLSNGTRVCGNYATGVMQEFDCDIGSDGVDCTEVDLSCQEGEMAVFAHLPAFAGEASWTITDANGDEVCAAEYPGTACHWYYGCEGGVDHHESGCCLPIDSGPFEIECADSGNDGWHGGYLQMGEEQVCDDMTGGTMVMDCELAADGNTTSVSCDAAPLCADDEFELFAHFPSWASEASWTATVDGAEICSAEYTGSVQELHHTG